MQRLLALALLLAVAACPLSVEAKGKKGKLNKVVEITRHDFHDLDTDVPGPVEIEGLAVSIELDHEATVLIHGIVGVGGDFGSLRVVIDGQPESDPLYFPGGRPVPILHTATLSPGTHEIKIAAYARDGEFLHFGYGERRLVVIVF